MTVPRVLAAMCALAVLGCQPVDEPPPDPDTGAGASTSGEDALGSPQRPLPSSLDDLLGELDSTAAQWQSGTAVAEIVVSLDEDRAWREATVTYLAPDADRFLVLELGPAGLRQERPTLEGLELMPVPADALAQLPDPGALMDPDDLLVAASPTLAECDVGDGTATVIYATGAPAAWDGQTWTEPPAWRATVSGDGAAVVDGTSGEAAGSSPCLGG